MEDDEAKVALFQSISMMKWLDQTKWSRFFFCVSAKNDKKNINGRMEFMI